MTIENPYAGVGEGTRWLTGNLHTHTTRSDGRLEPQAVIDAYKGLGHDFLGISDHDIFSGSDEWAEWNTRGLIPIPANEITRNGVHILHVGGDRKIEPDPNRQLVFDAVNATCGFAVVNHPNWYARCDHAPQAQIEAWDGFVGIEIYNGVIQWLEGTPYALDRWDMLLSTGRRAWGFAHDDFHFAHDLGCGYNVVAADSPDADSIIAALIAGRFYASTGVTIQTIHLDDTKLTVAAPDADRMVAVTKHGKRLAILDASELTFDLTDERVRDYVRIEAYGRGEKAAWTQPLWVR